MCLVLASVAAKAQDVIPFPDGDVGVPYFVDLFGGDLPPNGDPEFSFSFTFSITGGTPPPGLIMKPNGQIVGTPTVPGNYAFTISYVFTYSFPGFSDSFSVPFPVTIKINGAAGPPIGISPGGLSFSLLRGGTAPAQSITVSSLSSVSHTYSTVVLSGTDWLSVSPASGVLAPFNNRQMAVTVDASRLTAGTYSGRIRVSVSSAGTVMEIPVLLTVGSGTQVIVLSQSGLTFRTVAGGGVPPAQTLRVYPGGSKPLDFSASVATNAGGNWLSVTPNGGIAATNSSSELTVNVNPAGLPAGDYYGSVRISSPSVENSPQVVTVVLNIAPSTTVVGAQIQPFGLVFIGRVNGANPGAQIVKITNASPNPLTFAVTKSFENGSNWFTATATSASVRANQPSQVQLQVNTTGLGAGVYRGDLAIQFAEDDSLRHVTVLLIVLPASSTALRSADGCTPTKLLPVFTLLGSGFANPAGWPTSVGVIVVDDCGTPMTNGNVVASFSNGDAPLTLLSSGDGNWSATWQPQTVKAQVSITVRAQQISPVLTGTEMVGGKLQANPTVPVITSGGVVSAASYAARQPLAPGSFVAIFGTKLSNGLTVSETLPYRTNLGGTQVLLGARELPLQFTFDGQINGIIPFDVPPNTTQQLLVVNGNAVSVPEKVVISAAQPALFATNQSGTGPGVVVGIKTGKDPFLINAANPVTAGDALIIYAAGLGAVTPPVPAGTAAPSAAGSALSYTDNVVTVTLGGKTAEVFFSGLAPGFPAVYQINAYVPSGVAGPEVPIVVAVAGQSSTPVTIAIQ
ncbi:MAG: hypothetical protein ABI811_03600 [Acidobacteriota bacterium]